MSKFNLQPHLDSVQRNGFCIIKDVMPASMCASLGQRLIEVGQRHRCEEAYSRGATFVPGVINYEQSFSNFSPTTVC